MTALERHTPARPLVDPDGVRRWTDRRPDGVIVHHWHHQAPAPRPAPPVNEATPGATAAVLTVALGLTVALVAAGALTGATSGAVAGAAALGLIGILFGCATIVVWRTR